MKVKVCGMTNTDNLNEVLKTSPDFIGLIFYQKSLRYVQRNGFVFNTPKAVKKVGVFVDEQLDVILATSQMFSLDLIQLHGDESPEDCWYLSNENQQIIKVFSISDDFDFNQLRPYQEFVDYFLFDTKGKERGGSGVKFDWSMLERYELNIPFFLSGGIAPEDVTQIKSMAHPQLYGIDINSQFEVSPGIKKATQVGTFIHQLNK